MHAVYFVTDEHMADIAGAAALQTALHWGCDTHVFVERRDPDADVREVGGGRVIYHHDRLAGYLPADLPEIGPWPRIIYARFLAPRLLAGYRRLLYLDAGILAFGADPALWQVDIPSGLGAVMDFTSFRWDRRGRDRATWMEEIGVRSGRYANSGVMLIDPDILNRRDLVSRLPEYFRHHPAAKFPDQDFLAHAFDGTWTELSPRFNWQGGEMHLGLTRAVDPVFVHFTGRTKPWHGPVRWIEARDPAYIAIYDRVLDHAGLDPARYRRPYPLPALRRAKYAIRAWGGRHSFRWKKQAVAEQKWANDRRLTLDHISRGLAERRFAADGRGRIDVMQPRTFWDGRFVWAMDDLPPGEAIPANLPGTAAG